MLGFAPVSGSPVSDVGQTDAGLTPSLSGGVVRRPGDVARVVRRPGENGRVVVRPGDVARVVRRPPG